MPLHRKAYPDSLAIAEWLASDRSITLWQRDLSISYNRLGDVLVAQTKLDDALKAYRRGPDIFRPVVSTSHKGAAPTTQQR